MSFSLSARFSQYDEYLPSPNSYNIYHISEKKKQGPWLNTCRLNLKCKGDCITPTCSRCFRNVHSSDQKPNWRKPINKQRYSLDPNYWVEEQNKILAENINYIKTKQDSKKTEPEPPSFLNRPRSTHKCLKDEKSKPNFIRNTATRKAVKPTKKKGRSSETFSEDSLEIESTMVKNKQNNSYVVLPKLDESTVEEVPLEKASSFTAGLDSSSGVKKWKGLQDLHSNINPDSSMGLVQDKNRELLEELCKSDAATISDEGEIIFLINEEFIDDDYDYYTNRLDEGTQTESPELKVDVSDVVRTCLQELKKSHSDPSLANLEAIIKAAIDELKGEFLDKIYKTTESKMDSLLGELKTLLQKAGGDVEDACDQTISKLVCRLRNFYY